MRDLRLVRWSLISCFHQTWWNYKCTNIIYHNKLQAVIRIHMCTLRSHGFHLIMDSIFHYISRLIYLGPPNIGGNGLHKIPILWVVHTARRWRITIQPTCYGHSMYSSQVLTLILISLLQSLLSTVLLQLTLKQKTKKGNKLRNILSTQISLVINAV